MGQNSWRSKQRQDKKYTNRRHQRGKWQTVEIDYNRQIAIFIFASDLIIGLWCIKGTGRGLANVAKETKWPRFLLSTCKGWCISFKAQVHVGEC